MGAKGSGGLIALIGLVLLISRDVAPLPTLPPALPPVYTPITIEVFSPTFVTPPPTAAPITYKQYYEFVTQPAEDVEADPAITLTPMEHPQLDRPPGEWLTTKVNDVPMIPTPTGKLIPLPTVIEARRRIAIGPMLEPIDGEAPEEYFADVEYNGKIRKSINLRLKEIVNGAINGVTPTVTPTRVIRKRVAVETMLEPIGEEKPEQYFADVEYNAKIRKSISARLVPL